MQGANPTKLTLASLLELGNGTISLIWAALAILLVIRDQTLGSLGRTPLMLLGLLFGAMGITYLALGIGLWQRNSWARTGSLIAGGIGVPVGLSIPVPLLSAIMNLSMILMLRDSDVRAAFEEAPAMESLWMTSKGFLEEQPATVKEEWQPAIHRGHEPSPVTIRQGAASSQRAPEPGKQPTAQTKLLRKEPQHMAWLIPTTGPQAGIEFRLRDVTTVGRDKQNDIVLEDEAISGRHLRIRRQGDRFILHDLATTNGTFVNGEKTLRHPLTDGDLIEIGNTTLLFMQVSGPHED